ncbi:MAG: DUF4442 domain-containing protein [Candidatus Sericytochromatia bacterium]
MSQNTSKINFLFKSFAFFKIPMIFFCGAKILEIDEKKAVVKIPLNFKTRNHLNSMYFGTLAVGADITGGIIAFQIIQQKKLKISLVFKDMSGEFLKRVEKDAFFVCEDGEKVSKLINKTIETGNREEEKVTINVYTDYYKNPELVSKFSLTLSLKKK